MASGITSKSSFGNNLPGTDFLRKKVHHFRNPAAADRETCINPFSHHADGSAGNVQTDEAGCDLISVIADRYISGTEGFDHSG